MSFWKKIGLVDKSDFQMLLLEIDQLKTENKSLVEENRKLVEILIREKSDAIGSLINSRIDSVNEHLDEAKNQVIKCNAESIGDNVEKVSLICDSVKEELESVTRKEDIDKLKEENKSLVEENRKLVEVLIQQKNDAISSVISSGIDSLNEQLDEIKSQVVKYNVEEIEKITECKAQIVNLEDFVDNTNNNSIDKLLIKLDESVKCVLNFCAGIKEDILSEGKYNLDIIKENIEHINIICNSLIQELKTVSTKTEIDTASKKINKDMYLILEELSKVNKKVAEADELDKVISDIGLIQESLSNLWTIMKAIWVDSMLGEVDKTI